MSHDPKHSQMIRSKDDFLIRYYGKAGIPDTNTGNSLDDDMVPIHRALNDGYDAGYAAGYAAGATDATKRETLPE